MTANCTTCREPCREEPTRREAWFAALRVDDRLRPLDRLAAAMIASTANSAGENASLSGSGLGRAMGMGQSQARAYLYAARDAGWLHQTVRGRQNGRRGIASKYLLTVPTAGPVSAVGKASQQPIGHAPTADPGSAPPLPEERPSWAAPSLAVGSAATGRVLQMLENRAGFDRLEGLAYACAAAALDWTPTPPQVRAALGVLQNRQEHGALSSLADAITHAVLEQPDEPRDTDEQGDQMPERPSPDRLGES